ncbi:hypothetical protein DFP72DRAFT_918103 [Ephemerocybe angulata]|uniref:HRDC domain-containing protein n=1 Tax=Ephemerocybe angulata TaxID=980116 RepID=A0A8H6HJ12_9AGAR|nr:hypothetical protein DFP72DRAFT_918103 [Tulosesus angulatus]
MSTAGPSKRAPPTPETFPTFHTDLQTAALKATRASAGLPADLDFYKSVDEGFKTGVDRLEGRVLALIGRCLSLANGKGKGKEVRVEGDDLVDDFHTTVVDTVDVLLEKTDICLDEYSGKLKRPVAPPTSAAASKKSSTQQTSSKPYLPAALQHASNIEKPQTTFPTRVDNSGDVPPPHIRFLKHKFNARVPLGYVLQKDDIIDSFAGPDDEDSILPSHPYYYEITHLESPSHVFNVPANPSAPASLPAPVTYVVNSAQFTSLLDHLTSPEVLEIAVDLEHHSYRTYRGFLCLMQITTRSGGDFIVDLLVPEVRARIHELNEAFTDPSKIKVFHGAESDIVWLQQDFGLYVVGLFDTFHASKLLDLPRHSLSTLLELYADYTPDKKYQLADWRIRPIPEEMLHYAQSDTHWLLYLYDRLRGALVDKETSSSSRPNSRPGSPVPKSRTLLAETLFRSSQTSLRQYTTEVYDAQRGSGPGGWDSLAKKWNKGALVYVPGDDNAVAPAVWKVQRSVYRAVHQWRDRVSREEDESTRYVLPNHFLFTLAEAPPAEMNALLGMFRGGQGVPGVVRRRAGELLAVVKEAVRIGLQAGETVQEKVEMEVVEEMKENDIVVDEKSDSLVEAASLNEKDDGLWGTAPTSKKLTAKSSALLGSSSTKASQSTTILSTLKSALFGSALASSSISASSSRPADNPKFKAVLSRINSTLVIAPTVPSALASLASAPTNVSVDATPAEEVTTKESEEPEFDPVLGMQVDAKPMAYVPAAQRTTNTTTMAGMEDMGPIVVVGRKGSANANRKKRKREAVASAAASSEDVTETGESSTKGKKAASSTPGAEGKEEGEGEGGEGGAIDGEVQGDDDTPYDFAATSNVLDKGPAKKRAKATAPGAGGKKGGKGGKDAPKGAGYFYGDFKAAPKQRSDVKSGNKSYTFK